MHNSVVNIISFYFLNPNKDDQTPTKTKYQIMISSIFLITISDYILFKCVMEWIFKYLIDYMERFTLILCIQIRFDVFKFYFQDLK